MKILLAYASAAGSTKEIAERMHARLQSANIGAITLSPVSDTLSLADYDALIIGSCLHIGWLRSGSSFIKRISKELQHGTTIPIWAFSVGIPPNDNKRVEEEKTTETWLRKYVDLKGHSLFMGSYTPGKGAMDWVWKKTFTRFFGEGYDKRDWKAIDAWTDSIIPELKEVHGKDAI